MRVHKAKTAMALRWTIMPDAVIPSTGEILAKVKDERLAHQFAASDKMLAACEQVADLLDAIREDFASAVAPGYRELYQAVDEQVKAAIEKARGEQ